MIKRRLLTGMAACALGLWANNAVAQVQWTELECAGDVVYVQGVQKNGSAIAADRTNVDNAKFVEEISDPRVADGDSTSNLFVSLGYGGSITYSIGGNGLENVDGPDVLVFETSWATDECRELPNGSIYDGKESALVFLSGDNGETWVQHPSICRNDVIDFALVGLDRVTHIRLENDPTNTTSDGYDVDGLLFLGGCALPPAPEDCYGFEVVEWFQGPRYNNAPITDINRLDPYQMLGEPENNRGNGQYNFFSLGKNGFAILGMGNADGSQRFIITDGTDEPDLRIYETTFNDPSCAAYPEYALVEVSESPAGPWISVGEYCQSGNISIDLDAYLAPGHYVSYVRISTDDRQTPDDYFDVDGVEALWGCMSFELPGVPCTTVACDENPYVEGTSKTGGSILASRTLWTKALGIPQDSDTPTGEDNVNFVSLGYGGSMTLCPDNGAVYNGDGADFEVIETTWGYNACSTGSGYEAADVYVTMNGENWYRIGNQSYCGNFLVDISDAVDEDGNSVYLPYVTKIRVANSDSSLSSDGYDLDGIRFIYSSCDQEGEEPTEAELGNISQLSKLAINAYPNPTSGLVNFRYSSAIEGKVSLAVYNMNGQVVAQIADEVANAGEIKVANFDLSTLPNGVYLAKLTTPEGVTTAKVMLNK